MSTSPDTRFSPIIAALARPADLRTLPIAALHLVMAMRFCALFDRAGRDPVVELATRLGSIPAATATLKLIGTVGKIWPDPFVVGRPCCMAMTPDERTLAMMVRAAQTVDHAGFCRQIDGLVRSDRHDALFDQTVRCVAELAGIQKRA